MIPGDVNSEYLVVQLDLHLNKWRRHDDSLPSDVRAGPATCNEELDSFFASYIFAVLHLFFGQGQHPINARMQTILSIQFVVVFEIAVT